MSAKIKGDSPQAVALALLEQIARAEGWDPNLAIDHDSRNPWRKSRAEILAAYREYLAAVLGISSP